jgi:hypothetical protein
MKLVSTVNNIYWRPRVSGKLMAVPFLADGVTLSGIAVLHDERKFKSLAVVINVHECKTAIPGDVILFKEGQYEELSDASGEKFYWLDETAIVLVLENLFQEAERTITDSSFHPTAKYITK